MVCSANNRALLTKRIDKKKRLLYFRSMLVVRVSKGVYTPKLLEKK